jgi:hypothetical protein
MYAYAACAMMVADGWVVVSGIGGDGAASG